MAYILFLMSSRDAYDFMKLDEVSVFVFTLFVKLLVIILLLGPPVAV